MVPALQSGLDRLDRLGWMPASSFEIAEAFEFGFLI
jgi:hypothetical protein